MEDSGKKTFGDNVRRIREALGLSQEMLASIAGLDRSYIGGIERAERNPSLSAILNLASSLQVPPSRLLEGIGDEVPTLAPATGVTAAEDTDELVIRFRYDRFDAEYRMPGATRAQYDKIISILRSGLSKTTAKALAVSRTFLAAVAMWPDANPSDLWTFLVNRAYCDRANHPNLQRKAESGAELEAHWRLGFGAGAGESLQPIPDRTRHYYQNQQQG